MSELFENVEAKLLFQKCVTYRTFNFKHNSHAVVNFLENMKEFSLDDFKKSVSIIANTQQDDYIIDEECDYSVHIKNFFAKTASDTPELKKGNVQILQKIIGVIEWLAKIKTYDVEFLKKLKTCDNEKKQTFIDEMLNTKRDYMNIPNGFFHCMNPTEFRQPLIGLTCNGYSREFEEQIGWKLKYLYETETWSIVEFD